MIMIKSPVLVVVIMAIYPVYLLPIGRNLLDLSYLFDDKVIYFPGNKPFRLEVMLAGKPNSSAWLTANKFCGPEHGGTHMDAPYHFNEFGWKIDEIPFDRFVAPAVVVNISSKVSSEFPNAILEVSDLEGWESQYGRIPNASVVLLYSGHGSKWGNASAYLGTDTLPNNETKLENFASLKMNFPGFGEEAAEWLVKNRNIVGVGVDSLSLDTGNSTTFPAHYIFLKQNIFGIENVANLEQMPPSGATLYMLPMKIKGGSGAPTRILAQI